MTKKELESLSARIGRLELEIHSIKEILSQEAGFSGSSDVTGSQSPKSASQSNLPKWKSGLEKISQWSQWEFLFGGNWIAKIGILAILLATAWFLDLAFTNDWVTDSGKIYIGLIIAYISFGLSLYLAKRNFRVLTPSLFGAGISILYLTIFSAYRDYHFFSIQEAFLYLSGLGIVSILFSRYVRNEIIYCFGYVGTLLSPIVLSSGENSYRFLFAYLLIQLGLFLWASRGLNWRWAPYLVFFSHWLVFIVWWDQNHRFSAYWIQVGFIWISMVALVCRELFLDSTASPSRKVTLAILGLILGNLLIGAANLGTLTQFHQPNFFGHSLLAVGITSFIVLRQYQITRNANYPIPPLIFFGLAVVLYSLVSFSTDRWLGLVLVAYSSLLSYLVLYLHQPAKKYDLYRISSAILWGVSFLYLVFVEGLGVAENRLFLNTRFFVFMFAVGALFSCFYWIQKKSLPMGKWEFAHAITGTILMVLAFILEVRHWVEDPSLRNQGYNFVLGVFAVAFLAAGFRLGKVSFRKVGIGLILLIVGKFVIYDIWTLRLVVKIVAGFAIGFGLIVLGLYYEKFKNKILGES